MASGPGKDQDDPVHVKERRHSEETNPNAAFTTGAPRAAPAQIASRPHPSGVELPGEGRIPGIGGLGSAAAAVNREGKKVAVLCPPSSWYGSRGSSSSADAAEAEESSNASSPLPSPAPPLERVDEQPGEGRSLGADRKGKNAAVLCPAFCSRSSAGSVFSTSSSSDAEVDEPLVKLSQANEEDISSQLKDHCDIKAKDISENAYDENFFNTMRKLGNKIPLMEFADEYKKNDTFMQKFMILNEKYSFVRRTAGDGSCFYRSFIFSYMEKAVAIPDEDVRRNEAIRLRKRIVNGMQSCLLGLHRMSDAQFQRAFSGSEFVMKLIEDGLPAGELYERELTDSITSKILPLLRSLVEIELCTRESYYKWFLTEHASISELCIDEVRPDGGEASELTIMALIKTLGIPTVLGCVDMTSPDVERTLPPGPGNVSPVVATLLYMPGHYNILYAA